MPDSTDHNLDTHAGAPALTPPLPLSVAIICKDNRDSIGRTLESVRGMAAQIIAVDSGSTDGTLDILRAHGCEIHHQPWLGHVRQKQAALDLCAEPWILSLDSDESLDDELARAIRFAIERDDDRIDGFEVNRKVWYAGDYLHHAWQPEWRLRLVRRHKARWTGYDPHDKLVLIEPPSAAPRTGQLEGILRHDSIPTIADFLRKQVDHARTAANALSAQGQRTTPLRLVTSPIGAYLKQLIARRAYKDGWRGHVAAGATAAAALLKHIALLEATHSKSPPPLGRGPGGGTPNAPMTSPPASPEPPR